MLLEERRLSFQKLCNESSALGFCGQLHILHIIDSFIQCVLMYNTLFPRCGQWCYNEELSGENIFCIEQSTLK